MALAQSPRIYVLAGVNGSGKSSIAGAAFREHGADYYNPDEVARKLRTANPALSQSDANSAAWRRGFDLLKNAIEQRLDFAFESTLSANSIPRALAQAADSGFEVYVWYAGLATPDLNLARVRSRVLRGGHDIPEAAIRRRFEHSRLNLIALMPKLAALRIYDNSDDADPATGHSPVPLLLLHMVRGKIVDCIDIQSAPEWAKPLLAAAYGLQNT